MGPLGRSSVDLGHTSRQAPALASRQHHPANIGVLLLLQVVVFRRSPDLKCLTHKVGQSTGCDGRAVG
jgi:hypothetical protein